MDARDATELERNVTDATKHPGPRSKIETVAALEVLVLAGLLAVVALVIGNFDGLASAAAFRVSDYYAEYLVNPTPSPFDMTEIPGQMFNVPGIGRVPVFMPTRTFDLLTAREARAARDAYEAISGDLRIWSVALQLGIVLSSAAILNRRRARLLLWIAAGISILGVVPTAYLVFFTDWASNLPP